MTSKQNILLWALRLWIVFVFVQSLFFKFSDSPETQHIFGTLGTWLGWPAFTDYGGYVVGAVELLAAMMLVSRKWPWGAFIAFEVMCGALVFHLFTPLGIAMPMFDETGQPLNETDGGVLFIMACLTWLASLVLLVADWNSENSGIRAGLRRLFLKTG